MNLFHKSFCICLILFFTVSGISAADIKYGFVDSQKVADAHPVYKKKLDEIEGKIAPQKEIIEQKNKELEELQKDLENNPLASDEVKNRKREIIQQKKLDFRKTWEDFQQTIKTYEKEMLPEGLQEKILQEVLTAIQNVSKREGFQVIYEINKANVVYVEPSLDITERVKSELNSLVKEQDK